LYIIRILKQQKENEMSEPIEQITIDNVQYVVAELPPNVQAGVKKYEDWRARLLIARDEVQLVEAGLQVLGNNLVQAIRELNAAKASVEAAAKPADEVVAEVAAEVVAE
jgi:hypothetical protein